MNEVMDVKQRDKLWSKVSNTSSVDTIYLSRHNQPFGLHCVRSSGKRAFCFLLLDTRPLGSQPVHVPATWQVLDEQTVLLNLLYIWGEYLQGSIQFHVSGGFPWPLRYQKMTFSRESLVVPGESSVVTLRPLYLWVTKSLGGVKTFHSLSIVLCSPEPCHPIWQPTAVCNY